MTFLLHYLRKNDILFGVGANAGVYTVLSRKILIHTAGGIEI
jgi:hypothetical protein